MYCSKLKGSTLLIIYYQNNTAAIYFGLVHTDTHDTREDECYSDL